MTTAAPRQAGLRATFVPRKEEKDYLQSGQHTFTLPGRKVKVFITILDERSSIKVENSEDHAILTWVRQEKTAKTSIEGLVDEERATFQHIWDLSIDGTSESDLSRSVWMAVYPFWIYHKRSDRLAVYLKSDSIVDYLLQNGLGLRHPIDKELVLLDRNAFWQGAGSPLDLNWLQSPIPATTVFPFTLSFTRTDTPPVLTTHPLRPPKPLPGAIIYSRYIFSCSQHLELIHIDFDNPDHFAAYCKWQNSDRVNHGWREKGPDEKHRAYLREKLADPHAMGVLVAWDGVLAGYGEMVWSKEDGMAAFVGGLNKYDQGTHLLIGEEQFRGKHRFTACMVSLKHACFLRDPRTEVVVGEPRYDLDIIPLLATFLPQDVRKEVELPHKRAVFVSIGLNSQLSGLPTKRNAVLQFVLHRDRFFEEAILE